MLRDEGPPDNEPRRTRTARGLKTAVSARLSSKPRNEAQDYLELWSLKLNRARWARAEEQAKEKIKTIDLTISKMGLPEGGLPMRKPSGRSGDQTIDFRVTSPARRSPRS